MLQLQFIQKEKAGRPLPQVFNFRENPIRVVTIENNPFFAAKDICDALGLKNSRKATSKLDQGEVRVSLLVTPFGPQKLSVVNISGMFGLVFQSRKKEARAFRRWVTGEVLPQLMRTGTVTLIPHHIRPVLVQGVIMYPYTALLRAIGASTGGYAYQRARNYPCHFTRLPNGTLYVSQHMAWQIVSARQIYLNRKSLKAMQQSLPFNYNQVNG